MYKLNIYCLYDFFDISHNDNFSVECLGDL